MVPCADIAASALARVRCRAGSLFGAWAPSVSGAAASSGEERSGRVLSLGPKNVIRLVAWLVGDGHAAPVRRHRWRAMVTHILAMVDYLGGRAMVPSHVLSGCAERGRNQGDCGGEDRDHFEGLEDCHGSLLVF